MNALRGGAGSRSCARREVTVAPKYRLIWTVTPILYRIRECAHRKNRLGTDGRSRARRANNPRVPGDSPRPFACLSLGRCLRGLDFWAHLRSAIRVVQDGGWVWGGWGANYRPLASGGARNIPVSEETHCGRRWVEKPWWPGRYRYCALLRI